MKERMLDNQSVLDLEMTRFRIEQKYLENLQAGYGRKLKKNPVQLSVLKRHFERNPVWDYHCKIKICEELGLTMAQVQKWHWDHRQKLGLGKKTQSKLRPKESPD